MLEEHNREVAYHQERTKRTIETEQGINKELKARYDALVDEFGERERDLLGQIRQLKKPSSSARNAHPPLSISVPTLGMESPLGRPSEPSLSPVGAASTAAAASTRSADHDEPMPDAGAKTTGLSPEAPRAAAKTTGLSPEVPQMVMSMSESISSPPPLRPPTLEHSSLFRSNQNIHDAVNGRGPQPPPPPPPPASCSRTWDGGSGGAGGGGLRGKQRRRLKKKAKTSSPARLKDPEPTIPAPSATQAQSKAPGASSRAFGTVIDANQINQQQPSSAPTKAPTKTTTKPTSAIPLPKRVLDDLPPEIADPTQFGCNPADWYRLPSDLQERLVAEFTESNPGTRRYRQEGLEKLRLPRVGGWRKKAAKEIVASVRGRPGRFLRKDQKRKGIYYDVGDEKAKDAADTMLKNFRNEEARKNAGDESS